MLDILIVIGLIVLSGCFSGLTIGLMGLSKTEILRQKDLGNQFAPKVEKVIEDNNLLLVTLLLGNTAVNSTLAIFLGAVVGTGLIAGLVSTFLIMIFGEILPASIISKNPLKSGALFSPIVIILLKVLYPITKPIALVLDKWVGKEGIIITTRKEVIHMVEQMNNDENTDFDDLDRKNVIGALTLSEKNVGEHLSKKPFTLDLNQTLDNDLIESIKSKGFTRIPITNNGIVIGILNIKDLIGLDFSKTYIIEDFIHRDRFLFVEVDDKLDDVLNQLVKNHYHIAVVISFDTVVGVITLEDILEELLLTEIIDEFDKK